MKQAQITKLFDYRDVSVPEKLLRVQISEESIQRSLEQTAKRETVLTSIEGPAEHGDIVIAALSSANPVWNLPSQHINVGMDFFQPEIEHAVTRKKVQDEATVQVGEDAVTIHILSIHRRFIPALTDKTVCSLQLEGIATVDAYREYLLQKATERALQEKLNILLPYVIRQVTSQSEFDIPEEVTDAQYQALRSDILRFTGADENTPEEDYLIDFLSSQFHKKLHTLEEAHAALRSFAVEQVQKAALANCLAEQNHKHFGRQSYQEYLQELSRISGEELSKLEQAVSYENYLERAPLLYLNDTLAAYFRNRMKLSLPAQPAEVAR